MKTSRDPAPIVSLGARLRKLRQDHGMTQLAVAEQLCVDRTTYNKYEAGRVSPDQRGLVTLAEMFSVSVDYLLGHVEESDVTEARIRNVQLDDQEWTLVQMFRQLSKEEQQTLVRQAQIAFRKNHP